MRWTLFSLSVFVFLSLVPAQSALNESNYRWLKFVFCLYLLFEMNSTWIKLYGEIVLKNGLIFQNRLAGKTNSLAKERKTNAYPYPWFAITTRTVQMAKMKLIALLYLQRCLQLRHCLQPPRQPFQLQVHLRQRPFRSLLQLHQLQLPKKWRRGLQQSQQQGQQQHRQLRRLLQRCLTRRLRHRVSELFFRRELIHLCIPCSVQPLRFSFFPLQ